MADATVRLELDIFNHTFPITCTREFQPNLEEAARRLDEDLREALGDSQMSTRDLLNHVVALTLEYLCDESTDQARQEREELTKRIETAIERLQDCEKSLSES